MANFVTVLDQDPERRDRFISAARQEVAPMAGLAVDDIACEDFAAVWARGPATPFSRFVGEQTAALLFGHARDDEGRLLGAPDLCRSWKGDDREIPTAMDGYFAAISYDAASGLTAGGDLMGFFPFYYYHRDGVLLLGSSFELFRHHPVFRLAVCPQGLAGILMSNGLVGGNTLARDVRRLGAGNLLRCAAERAPREVVGYRLPEPDRHTETPFEAQVEIVEQALERAIHRHAPPEGTAVMMLSGGLDSRLIAGFLGRQQFKPPSLCLGQPNDFEVIAARRVADALQVPFHCEETVPTGEQYVEWARRTARWDHLSGGFGGLEFWTDGADLGQLAPVFWSGLYLDGAIGGLAYQRGGVNPRTERVTFEDFYAAMLEPWALPPSQVRELLSAEGGPEAVDEVFAALRRDCGDLGEGFDWRQVFRATLATRARFHHGTAWWRLSFHSWPIVPALDREFLEVAIDLPPRSVMSRRLEKQLCLQSFRSLAEIPRDTNSLRYDCLAPGPINRAWRSLNRSLPMDKLWQRCYWQQFRGIERRRYYRMLDLNSPRWQAVRRHAEPLRDTLEPWLDRRVLNRLLPPPESPIGVKKPLGGGAPRRTLLGLMLWMDDNL